ncbi:MAG: alpha,alpha-trehalase TreA [Bacteroidetes bacterium]|nr:MAG: alpha,alpha-trehalase TreA [Bacteroidota bacterium]
MSSCGQNKKGAAPADVGYAIADSLPPTPDELYGRLFEQVQMQQIFSDGKTFVDCTPLRPVEDIMYDYGMQQSGQMNLKQFVQANFALPAAPPADMPAIQPDVAQHIKALWPLLTRKPDSIKQGSSLLPLPNAYVVPGGRFREVYYWDSYFTMLGLAESGETQLIAHMVDNFAHLIATYGHIPNGNRSYYLSRSQPPFFSLMVQLLAQLKGTEKVYPKYLQAVEREYMYWMEGDAQTAAGSAYKRFVKMPDGAMLNRYWDDAEKPRQESYREDYETAAKAAEKASANKKFADNSIRQKFSDSVKASCYRNLRSGAASGWDFSSRWFVNAYDITTIETTSIIPVDLNCLLYFTERLLASMHQVAGNSSKAKDFEKRAAERQAAIDRYCYDAQTGFYTDYHFVNQTKTGAITAAGLFPFCFFESTAMQPRAVKAAEVVRRSLLAPGGLLATPLSTGQQWDAPNGWAPLQWMAVWGLDRCGQPELAADIARRWIQLNREVYGRTGKMMEKYNVVNTTLEAGGGEYPGQDGFGWTNGVLLALIKKYP